MIELIAPNLGVRVANKIEMSYNAFCVSVVHFLSL